MKLGFGQQLASQERSRKFMVTLGLFGIGIFLGFAYIGFTAPNAIPGRSYYTIYAHTNNADNITPRDQVRVDGNIVGQVLNPQVVKGQAILELQLSPSVEPLKTDTRMEVLPRSAVGVRYINLIPGTTGTNIPNNGKLAASQSSATRPLDTLLSTFDPATRLNMQKFFQGFGEGLLAQGSNLNDALGGAPAMLSNSGAGNQALTGAGAPDMLQASSGTLAAIAAHPGYVRSLISGSATSALTSNPVRTDIATGFKPESQALDVFAQSRTGIQNTLSQAPPTLTAATSDLPSVDRMSVQLAGFAKAITPGLQAGPGAFSETAAMLTEAKPALIQAKTVLGTVGAAVDPTLGLLHAANPVLQPLRTGLGDADPILAVLGQHGCDFYNFGKDWTSMMAYGVNGANVLRFDVSNLVFYGESTKTQPADAYPPPCKAYVSGSGF